MLLEISLGTSGSNSPKPVRQGSIPPPPHKCQNIIKSGHTVYILETGGIEIVLIMNEAEVEPSSPCKVSSSKSGASSLSGRSLFSHGMLIGLLVVAIATVRRYFLQKVAVLSYPGLKKKNGCKW